MLRKRAAQDGPSRRDFLRTGVATVAAATAAAPAVLSQEPRPNSRSTPMGSNRIRVGKENSTDIELYYEDHGSGSPVVLIHGWPLSGASWEKQTAALLAAGHRVITYDRRGFGRSSKPGVGYNYDTFAADLDKVLKKLDLKKVALVGFSMGSGEVTRYIGKYGSKRVRKAVLIGTLGPYLVKAPDNPEGVDANVFEGVKAAIRADRLLPPDATSRRQAKMIKNVKVVELPGGPHGVWWTHADRINSELVSFLA